jgi:cobalamin 5'-phosphate synthase/cobalamin synthase
LISQLAAAIGFLTRLPIGRRSVFSAKDVGLAARWFTLVGALLGGIYVGALWLLVPIFPSLLTAVMLVAIDAAVTGGMHLDALADTADGFGGGRTREDVLRIMRDHSIGAYGAIALVLCLALKVAALAALIDSRRAIACLMVAPVAGRWSAVLLGATQTYARPLEDDGPKSVGSPARFVGPTELIVATIIAIAVAAALDPKRGAAGLVLVAIASAWWGWRGRRRIGGVTGDTLGAGIEISEVLVFLLFTALR